MKRNLTIVFLSVLLMGCASCVSLLTSSRQSWEMVQSVGGLRVDDPVTHADGTVFLPVMCNVSGLDTITVKPTMINSALVVRKIGTRIRAGKIQIRIVTCVVDKKHTPLIVGVDLGILKRGTYQVEYLNPDGSTVSVRKVEITNVPEIIQTPSKVARDVPSRQTIEE
ncbi:MAG: hypothetical protein WCK89_12660 [bacterium]